MRTNQNKAREIQYMVYKKIHRKSINKDNQYHIINKRNTRLGNNIYIYTYNTRH